MSPLSATVVRACLALCASHVPLAGTQDRGAYPPDMGGSGYTMPVRSLKHLKLVGTLLQQYDFSRGSAAVATLLTRHYGMPVTEREVFEQMFANGDQPKIRHEGFSLLDMKRFLHTRGFKADGFRQPLDKLRDERVPAIALITENGYHHFVVVKGFDGARVLMGDPATGTRAMTRDAFEAQWQQRLLFVIHNRMDIARFNLVDDWRTAPVAPLTAGIVRHAFSRSGAGLCARCACCHPTASRSYRWRRSRKRPRYSTGSTGLRCRRRRSPRATRAKSG